MSRTDKDRPYWVRANDRKDRQYRGIRHIHATYRELHDCDEHVSVSSADYRDTWCTPHLSFYTYVTSQRSYHARIWYRQERAAQRDILRGLTRAANGGWIEDAEDTIDNRQTHVGSYYHGGWWD